MRILFISSTRIGDAVLSSGLLAYLVDRHPGARFTIVCGAAPAPLFAAVPGVERVIPLIKRRYSGHWFWLWRHCVGTAWDMVVDLRRSGIGYGLRAKTRYMQPRRMADAHMVETLAATLGIDDDPPAPRLWVGDKARADAARRIPAGEPVLALGAGANWPPKIWPAARFAALAERLTAIDGILPGGRIAVFAGPGERAAVAPLWAALPEARRIDVIGDAPIDEVAGCLERCALFAGNDSGLMHMAAASRIPTVGLFGPTPHWHYAPWGRATSVVRTEKSYEEMVLVPEFNHRDPICLMESLSVDRVVEACEALWRRVQNDVA